MKGTTNLGGITPNWLDKTIVRLCAGNAKDMYCTELYYDANKEPCFMCNKSTGNRVPVYLTKNNEFRNEFKKEIAKEQLAIKWRKLKNWLVVIDTARFSH